MNYGAKLLITVGKKSCKKICQFQKWQYLCTAFRRWCGAKQ